MKELKKIIKFKKELRNDLISLYYAGVFSDSFTDLMVQLTNHEEHEEIKMSPAEKKYRGKLWTT